MGRGIFLYPELPGCFWEEPCLSCGVLCQDFQEVQQQHCSSQGGGSPPNAVPLLSSAAHSRCPSTLSLTHCEVQEWIFPCWFCLFGGGGLLSFGVQLLFANCFAWLELKRLVTSAWVSQEVGIRVVVLMPKRRQGRVLIPSTFPCHPTSHISQEKSYLNLWRCNLP